MSARSLISHFIRQRYPALGQPQYLKYFLGSLAAVGATQLVVFGQGWLVYDLTQSAIMLGWLGAAASIPNLAVTLFGGVIADRYDKRWVLFTTSFGNMVVTALLTVLVLTQLVAVWHVLLIAALSSIFNGFDWPTRVAIFPQLVNRHQYLSAVALSSFIWQAMRMAVPALAGFLLVYTDTTVVFSLATTGYFVMCITVISLTMRPADRASLEISAVTQIYEGFRFIFRNDIFKYLLTLTFVMMFFCNSHIQLMPLYATLNLQGGAGLGLLLTAGGLGSIFGTIWAAGDRSSRVLSQTMLVSGLLTALTTIGFVLVSTMAWFYVALFLQLAAASFAAVFLITSMTTMQLCVPDQLRGRVMGIHTMCYSLLPLGGLFLGSLTEYFNAPTAICLGASIYAATLLLLLVGKANFRHLRFETLRPIMWTFSTSSPQSAGARASTSHETPVPPIPQ